MRIQVLASIALGLVLPLPSALAGETGWQEIAPDVRLRLITSDVREPDGSVMAALELDMPDTVKTYWHVPGETGIPTELDLSGSSGIEGHELLFPYPKADTVSGYLDYVYYGHTVLPIRLVTGEDPVRISAEVTMGICSDICVPAMATLSLPLDLSSPDRPHALRIGQALAETPIDWTGPGVGAVHENAGGKGVAVAIESAEIDPMSVIADSGPAGPVFGAPQKSPDETLILLPLLGRDDAAGLEGKSINLTFMTPNGPYKTSRRIMPALSTRAGQ